jgi:hypothetical protein
VERGSTGRAEAGLPDGPRRALWSQPPGLREEDREEDVVSDARHLIGLLLGTEDDWPSVFEALVRRLGSVTDASGASHAYEVERVTIEPFSLRASPRHDLVIDRLAYWYHHPREWLKKVALMDDVYLLNSPFTFQAMEKHAAYCAMMRLGLKVPETVLVPYKNPVDHGKYVYTAARYNRPFDLDAVAESVGYPLFMKPYDGGAWRGVSLVRDRAELHRAYDESGEMLMHLQQAVTGYDVFARSLSIGAETMVMRFDPEQPMHGRYSVDHAFLSPEAGEEVVSIGRTVNAFFRWEFNSCETLVRGGDVHPIDYANACPDVALTSLHYYFPWAMKALVRWSVFCTATGRRPRPHVDPDPWFAVADREDLSYGDKVAAYRRMADEHFQTERFRDFCDSRLPHLDEVVLDYVESEEFDRLLVATVVGTFPPHEHEQFVAHFRGLLGLWANDERARLSA